MFFLRLICIKHVRVTLFLSETFIMFYYDTWLSDIVTVTYDITSTITLDSKIESKIKIK